MYIRYGAVRKWGILAVGEFWGALYNFVDDVRSELKGADAETTNNRIGTDSC